MRRKTLIISLIVVVLLSGGIAALLLWPEVEDVPPEPTPVVTADTGELIVEIRSEVASVYIMPQNGVPYTLLNNPENGEIELVAPNALFEGFPTIMDRIFTHATALRFQTRVTEEADDHQLTLFGLDAPVSRWRVNRVDGTSVELMVGAEHPAGQGRYARRVDSREVFLINTGQSQSLTSEIEDVYNLSFLPLDITPGDEMSLFLMEHIWIEANNTTIELRRRTMEEFENAHLGMSQFEMLQPYLWEGNDYHVQSIILENVAHIFPISVEEANPADLSVYGLDKPDKLTVVSEDWTGTLLIGDRDVERNGRYVMIEGHDAVLFDPHGIYTFLNITDATQLLSQLVWIYHIRDVATVTFELEGITRVLTFEHDDEDDNRLQAWLDGNEISEINGRRVYIGVLNVFFNGGTNARIPATPPSYRFTIELVDGGSSTLELYRLNEAEFLIVRDGVSTNLFINRMTLQQNLLYRFELLDAGRDIP